MILFPIKYAKLGEKLLPVVTDLEKCVPNI